MESKTQASKRRPRTQKNPRPRPRTALPRTDTLKAKDRNARGQGQAQRTQAQVLSKKKKKKVFTKIFQAVSKINKKDLQNFFQAISRKKRLSKNFSGALRNFNNSKNSAVLDPRTGQFLVFGDLRPRGQGQGLDLRGQGQGLQNVSSRPRTSSKTPLLLKGML